MLGGNLGSRLYGDVSVMIILFSCFLEGYSFPECSPDILFLKEYRNYWDVSFLI